MTLTTTDLRRICEAATQATTEWEADPRNIEKAAAYEVAYRDFRRNATPSRVLAMLDEADALKALVDAKGRAVEMAAELDAENTALKAEVERLREVVTAYRAATAWVASDSWDGCSDCIARLKAASAFDGMRDPMTPDQLAEALKMLRPFMPERYPDLGASDE